MLDTEKETTTRTMEKSKEAEAQTEELIEGGTKRIAQVVCSMLSQGIPMEQIEQRTGLSYSVLEAAVRGRSGCLELLFLAKGESHCRTGDRTCSC